MSDLISQPNADLTVGADNKQGWNQPANRRHGFHHAQLMFRRTTMVRSRRVLTLTPAAAPGVEAAVIASGLTVHPAFSALVVAENNSILHQSCAADFRLDQPHSIQSITKMHIHLIVGELVASGRLDLEKTVADYLPWIGSAYAGARVADLLDMNVQRLFRKL